VRSLRRSDCFTLNAFAVPVSCQGSVVVLNLKGPGYLVHSNVCPYDLFLKLHF